MEKPANQVERDRLDSWKQIAEHIGRDVRTAIRWEHERGLPVHRVPGGRRGAVFAFSNEIDEWLGGSGVAGRDGTPTADAQLSAPTAPPRLFRRRPAMLVLLAGALVACASWAIRSGLANRARQGEIDEVVFGAHELVARSAGTVVWSHDFGRALVSVKRMGQDRRVALADLDGDGRKEVLASATFAAQDGMPEEELFCFSSAGRVLWSYGNRTPLVFRGGSFGPPFWYGQVVAYQADRQWRIAWSQNHHTWWPARVNLLDARGRPLGVFVHAGSIYDLAAVEGPRGPLILGGGVSNAQRAAMLFVLDGRQVKGHSPDPEGSPYDCPSCEPGWPLRYFVFPPSDISRASGRPYNMTTQIIGSGEDIEVGTYEDPQEIGAKLLFRFSSDLRLLHAAASDSWGIHDRRQREGRLDHSSTECPLYRNPPPVRSWTPSGGWVDVRPETGPRGGPGVPPRVEGSRLASGAPAPQGVSREGSTSAIDPASAEEVACRPTAAPGRRARPGPSGEAR